MSKRLPQVGDKVLEKKSGKIYTVSKISKPFRDVRYMVSEWTGFFLENEISVVEESLGGTIIDEVEYTDDHAGEYHKPISEELRELKADLAKCQEDKTKLENILMQATKVLQRHIVPDSSLSDREALLELYGTLDNRRICELLRDKLNNNTEGEQDD